MTESGPGVDPHQLLVVANKAKADLASLRRVSHRLALTDDPRLGPVLDKLLPRLLTRARNNGAQIQKLVQEEASALPPSQQQQQQDEERRRLLLQPLLDQIHECLVSMFSHILKRVKAATSTIPLPCRDLLDQLLSFWEEQEAEGMAHHQGGGGGGEQLFANLTLAFATVGVPKAQGSAVQLLPVLLRGLVHLQNATEHQVVQWHHLLLTCLERSVAAPADHNKAAVPATNDSSLSGERRDAEERHWAECRQLLHDDDHMSAHVYALLLDVLLYAPPNSTSTARGANPPSLSTLPPDGLSQMGADRLVKGPSSTREGNDWGADMSAPARRAQLKVRVLDLVAPTRPFHLLFQRRQVAVSAADLPPQRPAPSRLILEAASPDEKATTAASTVGDATTPAHDGNGTGWARTVAVLVVATGDPQSQVQERAMAHYKACKDSDLSGATSSASAYRRVLSALPALCGELLSLCLGQIHAEAAVSQLGAAIASASSKARAALPLSPPSAAAPTHDVPPPSAVWASKRRPLSESHATAAMEFVAKAMEEHPAAWDDAPGNDDSSRTESSNSVLGVAVMAVKVAKARLEGVTASGLTVQRAKHPIQAAQLLRATATRLTVHLDHVRYSPHDAGGGTTISATTALMSQCLHVACTVLSNASKRQASAPSTASIAAMHSSEGNVAVRDACYGVVCTLSRSAVYAGQVASPLFNCGEPFDDDASVSLTSVRTAQLLFGCACHEEERLRPRAVSALDALLGSYKATCADSPREATSTPAPLNPWMQNDDSAKGPGTVDAQTKTRADRSSMARSLLLLLWNAAQTYHAKAARAAAATWASQLLMHLDAAGASHLLCFLAGDSDTTAAAIALDGLGMTSSPSSAPWRGERVIKLPTFPDIVRAVFPLSTTPSSTSGSRMQFYWDFSFRGKGAALKFGVECLMSDLYDDNDEAILSYLAAICETLSLFSRNRSGQTPVDQGRHATDLLDDTSACLLTLLTAASLARTNVLGGEAALGIDDLQDMALNANSSRTRRDLSTACGRLWEDFDFWDSQMNMMNAQLKAWISRSRAKKALDAAVAGLRAVDSHGFGPVPIVHGSAHLGASAAKAFRDASRRYQLSDGEDDGDVWETVATLIHLLGRGMKHADDAIAISCADGLTVALSHDFLDAPALEEPLYFTCTSVMSELSEAVKEFANGERADSLRLTSLVRAAGVILSATTSGAGVVSLDGRSIKLGPSRLLCAKTLFDVLGSAACRKDEEIALVTGESLSLYADSFSPSCFVEKADRDLWPLRYDEEFAAELPPHLHVVYVLLEHVAKSSSPHVRNACAPALFAVVARAAKGIHDDPDYSSRSLSKELCKRLDQIQNVFTQLLADAKIKHLPRECCCLGLAACRGIAGSIRALNGENERASDLLNRRVLRAFGQSTKFASSAYIETSAQAEARRATERRNNVGHSAPAAEANLLHDEVEADVGGAAGMSEAALGAYREMAAASVALGRHDIFYGLLALSVTHSCWQDEDRKCRYSTRSLLGDTVISDGKSTVNEIRMVLRPHLGKLVPRILRARHDPNKQTRDQMTALWTSLTGGGATSREVVSEHLLPTFDQLLLDATSKLWRTRVGGCGALAEIIVGRTWDDLGGGDAVLFDDEGDQNERASAGVRLIRLWRVTVRAYDDVRGAVRDAAASLGRAVRSLTTRLCDPQAMEPPSGMKRGRGEHGDHERTAKAASATALRWLIRYGLGQQCAEAVGLCISTLVEVVGSAHPVMICPLLPDLLRALLLAISGLEPAALNFLQLKVDDAEGLERLRLRLSQQGPIATAVTKCLELIPGTTIEAQHAVVSQLDTALRSSAGFATRAAVADSVSTLCSTCPSAFRFNAASIGNPSVRLLRGLYFASNHDDQGSKRAAASAIRAIVIRSPNHLKDGGNADVWRRYVLPVAFVGKSDEDDKIAALWKEVWNEAGGALESSNSKHKSFGTRMEEVLLPFLVSEAVDAIQDVAWARRRSGARAIQELIETGVLAPSASRSMDVRRVHYRSSASGEALRACVQVVSQPRLWTGKSLVLLTAIELASKWTAFASELRESADDDFPLAITAVESCERDLFAGDEWFATEGCGKNPRETLASVQAVTEMSDIVLAIEPASQPKAEALDEALALPFEQEMLLEADEVEPDELCPKPSLQKSGPLTFCGFVRLVLRQSAITLATDSRSSDEALPYRVAALQGLRTLMTSLPATETVVYKRSKPDLLAAIFSRSDLPPVIVAAALGALNSMIWRGFGSDEADCLDEVSRLVSSLRNSHAWSIREASNLTLATLASHSHSPWLRQHKTVTMLISSASGALRDPKFWRVRLSGIKILESMVSLAGGGPSGDVDKQIALESLLPVKHEIVALVNLGLSDTEPQVAEASNKVNNLLGWWP